MIMANARCIVLIVTNAAQPISLITNERKQFCTRRFSLPFPLKAPYVGIEPSSYLTVSLLMPLRPFVVVVH